MAQDFELFDDEVLRIERDIVGASTYVGYARSQTTTTANASWLIKRVTVAGAQTEVIYASDKFDQIWDNRLTLFATPPFSNDNSYIFRGGNQHINIGDVTELKFDGTSAFSISVWARTDGTANRCIFGKQGSSNNAGYRVIFTSNRCDFHIANSSGNRIEVRTPNVSSADDAWHHVLVTYDGSQTAAGCKIYFDGVSQSLTVSQDTLSLSADTTVSAQIGIRNNTANDFDGFIDEVAIWNVDQTANAAAIYNSGSVVDFLNVSPLETNLVGWWRMGDNDTYPTVTDLSTSGNDGTATNMVPSNVVGEVP